MTLRVNNITLPVEQPEHDLSLALAAILGVRTTDIVRCRILRKSLDARSRHDLKFVYSAAVDLGEAEPELIQKARSLGIEAYHPPLFEEPMAGSEPLEAPPVIIGSGPAGILAAYYLAIRGYRPIVLERGQPVKERVPAIRAIDRGGEFDRENNYLFGEGGAGTFSDGRLTCRMSGPDVDWVLEQFVACGGKPSIRYEHRPHLGSNRLPMLVRNFRRRIEAEGGIYRFGCRAESLDLIDGQVRGVHTSSGYIPCSAVVLAIGHSARDTYESLLGQGVPMQSKPFQMGVRIEHPQDQVNRHKYGKPEYFDLLGAADYSLIARGSSDLFSFCMCAGGMIIPSVSEPEMFCTNGMSNSRHDTPFANSGLVVTLDASEILGNHPLAGVEIQRQYERIAFELAGRNYLTPIQRATDFIAGRAPNPGDRIQCSYPRGNHPVSLDQMLPAKIAEAIRAGLPIMDLKWRGDFLKNAILVGPEMRGSSPVRIPRDVANRQCPGAAGLYPVGEGAGYAGGIVSAAVDGLRTAKSIVERFAPLES